MQDFTTAKIEIFIPEEYVQPLLDALTEVGAGVIGSYDHCASIVTVRGTWRPLPGADPYVGQIGRQSTASEAKVEVNCRREIIPAALQAVRHIHPYEEPVINVIPLANYLFEA